MGSLLVQHKPRVVTQHGPKVFVHMALGKRHVIVEHRRIVVNVEVHEDWTKPVLCHRNGPGVRDRIGRSALQGRDGRPDDSDKHQPNDDSNKRSGSGAQRGGSFV